MYMNPGSFMNGANNQAYEYQDELEMRDWKSNNGYKATRDRMRSM